MLTTPIIEAFRHYEAKSGVSYEELDRALQAAAEADGEHPLFELEKGNITEQEFLRRLELQLPHLVRLDGFRLTYFEALHPNPELIAYMRQLGDLGFRMALLTNNVREWQPQWRAKLPEIDQIFELVVDSSIVGMRKPEPDIYELTIKRLGAGIRSEDCLFVDDLEPNVRTARSLGMRAVLFRSNEQALAEDRSCAVLRQRALRGGKSHMKDRAHQRLHASSP